MTTQYNINHSIDKLKSVLKLGDHDIQELSAMSRGSFSQAKKDFSKASLPHLMHLADTLNVDFTSLAQGEIDFQALQHHFYGDLSHIPSKYKRYQASKIDTIQNALEVCEKYFKSNEVTFLKRKLQINDKLLEQSNMKVSGLLLMDLFKAIDYVCSKKRFNSGPVFEEIGSNLCLRHKESILAKVDPYSLTPKKLYETVIETIHSEVEYNMKYRIEKSNNKRIIVSANTRDETKDTLNILRFSNEYHLMNILGYYGSVADHILDTQVEVSRLTSFRDELLFQVDYSHLH